jgi:pantoate--beta-alanine ligase
MPVRLIDGPTVREPDGLALSSRNRYLNTEQRGQALCLYRALRVGRRMLDSGERGRDAVTAAMLRELAVSDQVEYAEVRRVPGLENETLVNGRVVLAVAAKVGPARLIDNFALEVTDNGLADGYLLGDPAGI